MIPTFHFGPIDLPAYFTLLLFGFMLAIWLAWRESIRIGVNPNDMLDLGLFMLVFGIIGARILHVFADGHFWDYVYLCIDPHKVDSKIKCVTDAVCVKQHFSTCVESICRPSRDCFRVVKFWYGGLAYYGGFIASVVFGFWYIGKKRMGYWRTADICAPPIALGLIFGRLGCFFAGCCFGKTCAVDAGIRFPKGSPAWVQHYENLHAIAKSSTHSLSVYPTQLISSMFNLAIFAFLYLYLRKRKRFDGQVWWAFVALYALARFVIEYFRNDDRGVFFGGLLSTSQILGIPMILGAVAVMVYMKRRHDANPSQLNAPPE